MAEVKNAGGRHSMMDSPFGKSNYNKTLPNLRSQTLPRPWKKLPTDYGSGSTRNVSIQCFS
jgi:hypothetical protein